MMSFPSHIAPFEPFVCRSHSNEQSKPPFMPVAHDLIILNQNGNLIIAKNASASQMINALQHSNNSSASKGDDNKDITAALAIIRFEEEENPAQGNHFQSKNNWSELWPIFDCCSSDEGVDFVSRLRQADFHCTASISKNTRNDGLHTIDCKKIYYHVGFPDKHLFLAHHFHIIDGERKEMIRMVTYGLPLPRIETLLCKAMAFLKTPSSEFNGEFPGAIKALARVPHPKAILCSMLECAEDFCKTQVANYRTWIEKIEGGINAQRDTGYSQPRGLEINYVKLSEASIKLSEVRQKVQYSLSSIASLKEMTGLPSSCGIFPTSFHNPQCGKVVSEEPKDQVCDRWWHQLEQARVRLIALEGNFQQHSINIENLQERVKGILSIVSILLAERENEWGRRAQIQRQETYDNQLAIIKYQTKMLEQQEFVVAQTKRDNTVMKVIAVLTALFLPGTFIATVFSVPVFKWDQENPIGPHFKTYWYFTAPITTVLVVGLSAWLLKMRYDDRLEEKYRKDREKGVEETG